MTIELTLPWPPAKLSPNNGRRWTIDEIQALQAGVRSGKTHTQIATALGRTRSSVRTRANMTRAVRDRSWSDAEIQALRDLYEQAGHDGVLRLAEFAESVGRLKSNVSRKARQMGLATSRNRKQVEQRKDRRKFHGDAAALHEHRSELARERIHTNGHPRGMLGKKHTAATRAIISAHSKSQAAAMTAERQAAINMKITKTKAAHGTLAPNRPHGSWRAGWREVGGKRDYYRSGWEANYGCYLEWLKRLGKIRDWQHEPKTFWFDGVRRGSVSYLPDFVVIENDGREIYHEVKGWMDDRSRVKIRRMAKYHPEVTLVVIDARAYREIRRKVSTLVDGWRDCPRDERAP